MSTSQAIYDEERRVLDTILTAHSTRQTQLMRSTTTLAHPYRQTIEERQQAIEGLRQRIRNLCPTTLEDFALKNADEHDVVETFAIGPPFVPVTDNEFRLALSEHGWHGLASQYPGTKGIIDFSRIGLSDDATQALVYFGHLAAAKSGIGSYRLFNKRDNKWEQGGALRAWIS